MLVCFPLTCETGPAQKHTAQKPPPFYSATAYSLRGTFRLPLLSVRLRYTPHRCVNQALSRNCSTHGSSKVEMTEGKNSDHPKRTQSTIESYGESFESTRYCSVNFGTTPVLQISDIFSFIAGFLFVSASAIFYFQVSILERQDMQPQRSH